MSGSFFRTSGFVILALVAAEGRAMPLAGLTPACVFADPRKSSRFSRASPIATYQLATSMINNQKNLFPRP